MATTSTKKKQMPRKRAVAQRPAKTAPWHLRRAGDLRILRASRLAALDWLVHGFSTRAGGSSMLNPGGAERKTGEKVLNLGFTDWDTRGAVEANRKMFFESVGVGKMRFAGLRQIHSDIVHCVGRPESAGSASAPPGIPLQGDALISREPGVVLAVQTADCVPILLADPRRRAIAAVHAGWRGTLSRIAEKTLGRMAMEFSTRPEDVIAALGPGIGQCCYEVGGDVAKEFQAQFPSARDWFEGPFDALASGENDPNWLPWLTMRPPGHAPPAPRVRLDLIAANRAILSAAGVPAENIASSGYCTSCHTDLFFSYRRERTSGRMMAVIGIRGD